jgi:hypothetical protein
MCDSVAECLRLYEIQIQSILSNIQGLDSGGTCIVDELFVVRFILADEVHAEINIRAALEWRRQNREVLLKAAQGIFPHAEIMHRHVKKNVCGWLNNSFLLNVVRAGLADAASLMRELSQRQCVEYLVASNEQLFYLTDQRTRATGMFCKSISVIDLQGFSMGRFDRRFHRANGESTHLIQLYYPSLWQMFVLINLPSAFRILYSVAKVFMSKSALERQKICPAKTLCGSASDCPYLRKIGFNPSVVPFFLGGAGTVPESLQVEDVQMDE